MGESTFARIHTNLEEEETAPGKLSDNFINISASGVKRSCFIMETKVKFALSRKIQFIFLLIGIKCLW